MSGAETLETTILKDRGISYATTDRNLVVQRVVGNAAFLGRDADAALGRSLIELMPELIGSEEALASVLAGELPRFQVPKLQIQERTERDTSYYTIVEMPHRNEAGEITGLIHVVEEVSEAAQLEQRITQHRNELRLLQDTLREQNAQLLAANSELRRVDEVKSAFVSVAAHELRTPLASIAGYLEMLLDGDAGPLGQRQREYLQIVNQSAARLLHITRDLLDVARIESGRLDLIFRPTDLSRVVNDTIAEQGPQLEAKGQRLVLRVQPGLPFVLCDADRTVQIIGNLLNNASKYSPPHSDIIVEVGMLENDPSFAQVCVTDQGAGIEEIDRTRLFRPFFRARNVSASGTPGTGLGLPIARALTELHGGTLTFDSQPGAGSTFRITLPVAGTASGSLAPRSNAA